MLIMEEAYHGHLFLRYSVGRDRWNRSRSTRGGTVGQQTASAKPDHLYLDSLLSQWVFCLGSVRSGWIDPQFAAAELILNSTTNLLRWQPDRTQLLLLLMAGDIHPNPGPTAKYPCPVFVWDVTSRRVSYRCTRCSGWVQPSIGEIKIGPVTPARSSNQQSTPPSPLPSTTPAPSAAQFNANGIGNKLTELGVAPREFSQTQSSPDVSLASTSLITSCSW